jgi:hypothetical protein
MYQCSDTSDFRWWHWALNSLEMVCKGPRVELTPGISFKDKGGKVRHEVRAHWWQEDLSTYRKAAIEPPGDTDVNPDVAMPAAGDAGRRSYLLSRILAEGGVPRGRSDGLAAGVIAACEGAVAIARAENSITPFHLVVAEQLKAIKEAMV